LVIYYQIAHREDILMWRRNLLFVGLIGGGLFTLGANLMPRQPKLLTRFDASTYQAPDFTAAVERVNVSFRHQWREQKFQSASLAPDLAVARRLALGLVGTIPSLEEVRQFEYLFVSGS
jgi:hypothetical protein